MSMDWNLSQVAELEARLEVALKERDEARAALAAFTRKTPKQRRKEEAEAVQSQLRDLQEQIDRLNRGY